VFRKRRRAELIETIGGGELGGRYISPSKPIGVRIYYCNVFFLFPRVHSAGELKLPLIMSLFIFLHPSILYLFDK
jgi:hypothetical protein